MKEKGHKRKKRGRPQSQASLPGSPQMRCYQDIRAHLETRRTGVAKRLCRRLLQQNPCDSEAMHLLGLAELLRGEAQASVHALRQAIELRGDVPQYHCNLGEAQRQAGELEAAVMSCRRALVLQRDYLQAHINLGACLFALGQFEPARAQFERALTLTPDDPGLITSRADALRELGDVRAAREGYERALQLDPDLAHAHANLGPLLLMMGLPEHALAHCARAVELDSISGLSQCNLGRCLSGLERLDEAMDAYAVAYDHMPDSPLLCCNIGQVWQEVSDLQQAELWFERARGLDPQRPETRCSLAGVWREQGQVDQALEVYRQVLNEAPGLYEAHLGLAHTLWDEGDADSAVTSYRQAAELRPQFASVHASVGQVLASAGDIDGAVASNRAALEQNPRSIPALAGLATTLRGKLPLPDVEQINRLLNTAILRDGARASLHHGLAMYYDGIGAFAEAGQHAEQANALTWAHKSRRGWRYNPTEHEQEVDRLIETFSTSFFERTAGFGVEDCMPVFVVGMPRSGTTLTEQILASHPHVFGAGERPFASRSLARLPALMGRAEDPLACVPAMEEKTGRELADWHLAKLVDVMEKAGGSRKTIVHVIDKMPDNYLLLGWLVTLFPKARLIHCRRDVRDVALSCWMVQFACLRWACNLEHIAQRIFQYQRLMKHWLAVLPLPMLEVDYEALVDNQEAESRRLINWLGLEWDPNCLEFYRCDRLVRTASVTQVRQPIYQRSVARWRAYEQWLAPVLARLQATTAGRSVSLPSE